MKKFKIFVKTLLIILVLKAELNSKEPFVVLEYGQSSFENKNNIDRDNPFLKNANYFKIHTVEFGDSLSGIMDKYYKNTGLNRKVIEISIIEINKKAFVRGNPNYLFAGSKIRIPSINEIKNLVSEKPKSTVKTNKSKHIYYFGVN